MSQQDETKAAELTKEIADVMFVGTQNRRWLTGLLATALEQRSAEEREAAAVKCDELAKQHRQALRLGTTWNSAEECATAIRQG